MTPVSWVVTVTGIQAKEVSCINGDSKLLFSGCIGIYNGST